MSILLLPTPSLAACKLNMQLLCIVLFILASRAGLAVQGGRVKTDTQTQTQSYEKLLQNVRSGIFDDPDNPDPVKTELEAVLDKSRFL